jgi:hypothetical protein
MVPFLQCLYDHPPSVRRCLSFSAALNESIGKNVVANNGRKSAIDDGHGTDDDAIPYFLLYIRNLAST